MQAGQQSKIRLSGRGRGRRVAALHLRGMTAEEIAEVVGVDLETVNQELERMRERWREARDVEELRGEELMRLSLVEEQAWEAWERSRDATAESGEERDESRAGTAAEGSRNHWRYLEIALKCSTQRRRLLGLDAAPRVAKAAETKARSEQRERLGRILDALRPRSAEDADQTGAEVGAEGAAADLKGMDNGQLIMDNDGRERMRGGGRVEGRGGGERPESVVPRNVAGSGTGTVGVVTIYKPELVGAGGESRES